MDEGRKKLIKRVPMRKLVASIKKDLRKVVNPPKPKKK